ncbi:hypothetical protein Tco_0995707 [Tanacetum coccineum]
MTTTVPEKTITPRSCLRWKQTGKIFKIVGLRWIPIGKLLNSCTGKVDSTSFNGQKQQRINLNADTLYNAKQENLRVWLLKMLISKKPVPEWPCSSMIQLRFEQRISSLVLHQMMSDHNSSDLAPQRQMVSAENNTSGPETDIQE